MEPLFTTREVAELVGASHLLVRQWIVRGHLPHVEIGKYNYVRLKDLETLLKTGRPAGLARKILRRSTYSHLSSKSPTEIRNMLWNRYQYSLRKERERRIKAGESLRHLPKFLEWIHDGGYYTKRALHDIKRQLKGVKVEQFLQSIESESSEKK